MKATQTITILERAVKDLEAKIQSQGGGATNQGQAASNSGLDALKKQLKEALQENKLLQKAKEDLTIKLKSCVDELKKAGKTAPVEMSGAGQKKVKECVKDVYREFKFVLGEKQRASFSTLIYDSIKDDKELGWSNKQDPDTCMDLEDFQRVYMKFALDCLNKRRQYTQTKCLNACISKFVHVALKF